MFIGLAGKHPNKYPNKIPLISQQYPINIPWISRSLPRFFAFPSHFQSNDMNGQAGGANVRPGHRRRLGGGNTKKAKRWESSHVEPIRYKPGYVIGGLEHFFFLYIGNNHPNWLSYFSEGLKPPTSYVYAYILSEMGNSFSPVSLSGIQLYIPMYWLVSSFFYGWQTANVFTSKNVSSVVDCQCHKPWQKRPIGDCLWHWVYHINQWIGWWENLQETMVFTMKYRTFL